MQAEVQAGKFVYRPPWVQQQDGANKTGHSGVSSLGAAFLTPGVPDERRNHSATPTLVSVCVLQFRLGLL